MPQFERLAQKNVSAISAAIHDINLRQHSDCALPGRVNLNKSSGELSSILANSSEAL